MMDQSSSTLLPDSKNGSPEDTIRSGNDKDSHPMQCPRHKLPIRGVCLHFQSAQKVICGRCFKELPEELIKAYEDINDFISDRRTNIFIEEITILEKESQKNLSVLKNSLNSVDHTFEKFIEHVSLIKYKIKEQMSRKYDQDYELLTKVAQSHANFRALMKDLLKDSSASKLSDCVENFIEVSDLLRTQIRLEKNRFSMYVTDNYKQCSQQIDFCKTVLDRLIYNEEPANKMLSLNSSRNRSVSPMKRNSSLSRISAKQIASMNLPIPSNLNVSNVKTAELERKEPNIIANSSNIKLVDLTKNFGLAFENIETKLKVIEAMTYLPNEDLIVLGGMVRGDQFHKIVLQKLSSATSTVKILNAHSNTINYLLGSDQYLFSCAKDKMLKVWELSTYDCIIVLKHETNIMGMLYDNNYGTLYSYGHFLDIRVWDLLNKKENSLLKVPTTQISQACFVESQGVKKWIAVGCEQTGKIFVIDLKSSNTVLDLEGHAPIGFVDIVHFSEPNLLVACSTDGLVKIWDLNRQQPPLLSRVIYFNSKISSFNITSMASGHSDGLIFLANSTHGIMAGTATEARIQGHIKFDVNGVMQHSKLLYLDDKGILISANKFNGKLVAINVLSLRSDRPFLPQDSKRLDDSSHFKNSHLHKNDISENHGNSNKLIIGDEEESLIPEIVHSEKSESVKFEYE